MCVRELGKRDPTFAEALKTKTYAKFGLNHPDLRAVRPCPVPLIIVGNKYDIFKVKCCGAFIRRLIQSLSYLEMFIHGKGSGGLSRCVFASVLDNEYSVRDQGTRNNSCSRHCPSHWKRHSASSNRRVNKSRGRGRDTRNQRTDFLHLLKLNV